MNGDRGSVTAWLLVVPLLVLVLGGLSLDLWAAASTRGRVAAIADDAAVAGAAALDQVALRDGGRTRLDPAAATAVALAAVDGHPDAALLTGRTASATPDLVTVTVTGAHHPLLLRLVGAPSAPVVVTGAAAPVIRDG